MVIHQKIGDSTETQRLARQLTFSSPVSKSYPPPEVVIDRISESKLVQWSKGRKVNVKTTQAEYMGVYRLNEGSKYIELGVFTKSFNPNRPVKTEFGIPHSGQWQVIRVLLESVTSVQEIV